jgi:hypothetical protein
MQICLCRRRAASARIPLVVGRVHWVRAELVAEVKFLAWNEAALRREAAIVNDYAARLIHPQNRLGTTELLQGGRLEEVEALCHELGLTYVAEFEAGGEWHPGLVFRQKGRRKQKVPVFRDGKGVVEEQDLPVTREWAIAEIGRGPMIDGEDAQKHLDAGTLAGEIALMATVHKFPWKIDIVDNGGSQ